MLRPDGRREPADDGQNRSLRSLFWPSCAGFHPELSAVTRCARDIGHLRVCAAHSSSLNPFGKKMQAFSNLRDFANPAHVIGHFVNWGWINIENCRVINIKGGFAKKD